MKLSAHSVVVVPRHGAEQRAVLPVPYPNRLIIRGADNPRELMVEEDGPNVIQVPVQCEQTPPRLVRPHLDLVVITTRYEQGLPRCKQALSLSSPLFCSTAIPHLCFVKVDTADGSIVLFEPINQRSHAVIPQLDGRGVERDEDPWSGGSVSGIVWEMAGELRAANRLGWNAMPFARDDLDSNCRGYQHEPETQPAHTCAIPL